MGNAITARECICEECQKPFTNLYRRTRFCSQKCRLHSAYKRNYIPSPQEKAGIDRAATGAASELIVAADLLRRGYEVFRALSPHASCDLAILHDGKLLRVEVRTGRKAANRQRAFFVKSKKYRSDIWAVVLDHEILYEPPII